MLFNALSEIYTQHEILIDEAMSKHTSFKIGGKAKVLVIPRKIEQIKQTLELCHKLNQPLLIMGNGSNILVEDSGIDALVVKITDALSEVRFEGDLVIAEAGVLLSKLSKIVLRESLQGFEFASGIPGTLGGAIFMNAGAYGGEMKDVVEWVDVMTMAGDILRVNRDQLEFGYRTSIVKDRNYIVLRVGIRLTKGNMQSIIEVTNDLTKKRVSKQPLELPSAGSTFKRPSGRFAGQLIEEAGLRGLRYGDAQVSEKHCGFVVNLGNATCNEVLELISVVQKVVFDTFGVDLEREVRIFGKE